MYDGNWSCPLLNFVLENAMRRPLMLVSLGAAMLLLSGCAAGMLPVLGIQALSTAGFVTLQKSANDRQADRCFELDTDMEKKKLSEAEKKRDRKKAGC